MSMQCAEIECRVEYLSLLYITKNNNQVQDKACLATLIILWIYQHLN